MNDDQLLRYSRQIMLPQVDIAGQEALLASRALIIGAGGLGSPAAMYLAAAGIGQLAIADYDVVDLSNLQRQLLHRSGDIGREKTASARDTLMSINPDIQVTALPFSLQDEALEEQVRLADIVLDCSDNFVTRFSVNAACVRQRTPLVSGAAIRLQGQLAVFDSRKANSPCYGCLYREGEQEEQTCAENGVLSPLVGIIGSLQALEAIKVILALGNSLAGRLILFDGLQHEWRNLTLPRDPACPVCSQHG
ncbi:MAG: molybdopterin-synthase adenylyltransferase MoeB [Gammaproteobacteria bacterium]|jgi:adenylyltransferase/sulfurtransferase|nr:molybdopterin-synthase adenylyltransferase MoeB [Gammaproteobacteria bacterium]